MNLIESAIHLYVATDTREEQQFVLEYKRANYLIKGQDFIHQTNIDDHLQRCDKRVAKLESTYPTFFY